MGYSIGEMKVKIDVHDPWLFLWSRAILSRRERSLEGENRKDTIGNVAQTRGLSFLGVMSENMKMRTIGGIAV